MVLLVGFLMDYRQVQLYCNTGEISVDIINKLFELAGYAVEVQ